MFAFNGLLMDAAEQAGIKTPADPEHYDPEQFPHWHVFVMAQIGSPMPYAGVHWENAKVIAAISEPEVRTLSFRELCAKGFGVGFAIP
jgi:hypothetical protein